MVRDPALRAVSHHAMIADKAATPQQRRSRGTAWLGKSVREVAEAELVELLRAGVVRCVCYKIKRELPPSERAFDPG